MNKIRQVFINLLITFIIFGCGGNNSSNTEIDEETPIVNTEESTDKDDLDIEEKKGTISGIVRDVSGKPLNNVRIFTINTSTTTNSSGEYILDLNVGEEISIIAELDTYTQNNHLVNIIDGETTSLNIELVLVDITKQFNASSGSIIHINDTIIHVPNSFISLNKEPYLGVVTAEISYRESTSDEYSKSFPNVSIGLSKENENVVLQSYGLIYINFKDTKGNTLNISEDKTISFNYPIPQNMSETPSSIPLWYFDIEQATWVENTNAELDNSTYTVKAKNKTTWNLARKFTPSQLTSCVVDAESKPSIGSQVYISAPGWNTTVNVTNTNGEFNLSNLPSTIELTMYAEQLGEISDPLKLTLVEDESRVPNTCLQISEEQEAEQTTVSISGKIEDSDKNGISNQSISISSDIELLTNTNTDENGFFTSEIFERPANGKIALQINTESSNISENFVLNELSTNINIGTITIQSVVIDTDNDGISDEIDNCPTISNIEQTDTNNNGIGDLCDNTIIETSFNYITSRDVIYPNLGSTVPSKGESRIDPTTNIKITRLTDASEFDNSENSYIVYSRYTPENTNGDLFLAFGDDSHSSWVLERSTGDIIAKLKESDSVNIGENHEVRWDLSGNHPYRIYFRNGMKFYMIDDVRNQNSTRTVIKDFSSIVPNATQIYNDVEGDSSNDSDHWAWMATHYDNAQGGTLVDAYIHYQVSTDTIHTLFPSQLAGTNLDSEKNKSTFTYRPNMVEISPDGTGFIMHNGRKWDDSAYGGNGVDWIDTYYDGAWLWPLDFDISTKAPIKISVGETHSGWSFDKEGNELFISQNNRTDKLDAILIDGTNSGYDNRIETGSHSDYGWSNGFHYGKMPLSKAGWIFVNTYSTTNTEWGTNQLFMVQIKDESESKIWRIGSNYNKFDGDYRDEAPAAINTIGNRIYVSNNWGGMLDHSEVFVYELPNNWNNDLELE